MRRRDFITLLGGSTAAWPLHALAQERSKTHKPRLAVLIAADGQIRLRAIQEQLMTLGWIAGHNLGHLE